MPFPPTFTNTWDTTFPPDTQLANLLGADLRQLRVDVMQRLSLLSGTLANRPTPEIFNATWGGAGYGLLYFSTDTGQIFQWNGGAWTDITTAILGSRTSVIFRDTVNHNHTGTITEDTIYTAAVAANSLGTTGILRGKVIFSSSIQTQNFQVRVRFGGTSVFVFTGIGGQPNLFELNFTISNQASTLAKFGGAAYFVSTVNGIVNLGNASFNLDTTISQNLTVTMQNTSAVGDTQQFNLFFLELL